MKQIFILAFTFLTINCFGQCTECTSVEEASKAPLSVKSLQVNSYVNKISLDAVPAVIAKMTNLEILFFTDQPITRIPSFIGELKNLKELSFAGCKIETLPEEIYNLKDLREMILFDNSFSEEYKKELKKNFRERLPNTKLMLEF